MKLWAANDKELAEQDPPHVCLPWAPPQAPTYGLSWRWTPLWPGSGPVPWRCRGPIGPAVLSDFDTHGPWELPVPLHHPQPGAWHRKAPGLYKLSKPWASGQEKQAFTLLHLIIKSSLSSSCCLIRRSDGHIQGTFSLVSRVTRTTERASRGTGSACPLISQLPWLSLLLFIPLGAFDFISRFLYMLNSK